MGAEKGAPYYDQVFEDAASYATHFTASPYYPCWMVVAHQLRKYETTRILDLGCGPGQFAEFCAHYFPAVPYLGIDFSPTAIAKAKLRRPEAMFLVDNLAGGLRFQPVENQTVVCLEMLEHVNFDCSLLASIRDGAAFIGSVPNFDWDSHLRHFATVSAVRDRYGRYLSDFEIQDVLINEHGTRLFIFSGVRNAET